jgi:hypothetical protein
MVAPTCFGITLPSSGSVPSAFWEMLNWAAVDRIVYGCVVSSDVANINLFVGVSRILLLGILIFKGLTARRLYRSFGVKGLNCVKKTARNVLWHSTGFSSGLSVLLSALRWCHRGVGRSTEETAQFSVWKATGKESSEACAIASQNCAVYSVFPSGMTSHSLTDSV